MSLILSDRKLKEKEENVRFILKKILKPLRNKLMLSLKKVDGRNNKGRISSYHRGGGCKRKYRLIDFKRGLFNILGLVLNLERDPYRSANIALILYKNGVFSYIVAPSGLQRGDLILSSSNKYISYGIGNSMPLRLLSTGLSLYNLEFKLGMGGQLSRSAGSFSVLLGQISINFQKTKCLVKFKSGEEYFLSSSCLCSLGVVSNINHKYTIWGKAGKSRRLGFRPHVRGVAMNPVDHPHGGGEGKTSGGRCSVSFSGILSKGKPTRRLYLNKKIIIKRQRLLKKK